MKKIFTLLFCALTAFAANAQVEFIHNGGSVAEGATIEFHAEVLDFGDGFCLVECSPDAPFVRNAGTSEAKVTVTVTKTNAASDRLTWCGITSSCMPINGESETRSCTLGAGEQTALALHGDFTEGVYGTYTAKVTAKAGLSGSKTIYIKFVYSEENNIENTVADRLYVSGKTLNYSFGNDDQHTINLYSVSGRLVKSAKVSQKGNLSLSSLNRGVYIYEVVTNGKRQQAHKFVIK